MGDASEIQKAFGKVLADARKSAGLSQQALALECGLDRTYISLLERGLRQPSLTTLLRLANQLPCSAAEMVARVECTSSS